MDDDGHDCTSGCDGANECCAHDSQPGPGCVGQCDMPDTGNCAAGAEEGCAGCCCEDEPTIGDILNGSLERARKGIDTAVEEGKRKLTETMEPELKAAEDYAVKVKGEAQGVWEKAAAEAHLGYRMLTAGYQTLDEGMGDVLGAKPSELDPRKASGLKRLAAYTARLMGGAIMAGAGAVVFPAEEAVRSYAAKRQAAADAKETAEPAEPAAEE